MSDHFDAPGFTSPDGDGRIDITDHYVFRKPDDATKTIFVLNVNPLASATDFRSDAVYETLIDTNGDSVPDISFQYRFTAKDVASGTQSASVRKVAKGGSASLITGAPVSFDGTAVVTDGANGVRFFAGLRSDPFFFDTVAFLSDMSFHNPGTDFFADKNVYGIVLEVPNTMLGSKSPVGVWTRTLIPSTYNPKELMEADQAGRPGVSSFYCSGEDLNTFNQAQPDDQRNAKTQSGQTFLESFISTLKKWGYPDRDAKVIALWLLPDILQYDYSKATNYPNGRKFQDDAVDYMLKQLTKGQKPSDYVGPHTDYLTVFPYLGNPHQA
jgi:hypothetical protein